MQRYTHKNKKSSFYSKIIRNFERKGIYPIENQYKMQIWHLKNLKYLK